MNVTVAIDIGTLAVGILCNGEDVIVMIGPLVIVFEGRP